jgi:hypothetical protein
MGRFPDRGEVSMVNRKIEKLSEIRYTPGTEMLQVQCSKAIRASQWL